MKTNTGSGISPIASIRQRSSNPALSESIYRSMQAIERFYNEAGDDFPRPGEDAARDYAFTEAAEMLSAWLKATRPGDTRRTDEGDWIAEAADTFIMVYVTAAHGHDADDLAVMAAHMSANTSDDAASDAVAAAKKTVGRMMSVPFSRTRWHREYSAAVLGYIARAIDIEDAVDATLEKWRRRANLKALKREIDACPASSVFKMGVMTAVWEDWTEDTTAVEALVDALDEAYALGITLGEARALLCEKE